MKTWMLLGKRIVLLLSSLMFGGLATVITLTSLSIFFLFPFPLQILTIAGCWLCAGIIFYFLISWGARRFSVIGDLVSGDLHFQEMLRKVFLAIYFLFPASLIAYEIFKRFREFSRQENIFNFMEWFGTGKITGFYLIGTLFIVLFSVFMIFVIGGRPRLRQVFNSVPDYYFIIFIVFVCVLTRWFFIQTVNTQTISDFEGIRVDAIRVSQGLHPENTYVATNVMVAMIYGALFKVFGPHVLIIKVFHAIIYSLSGIFVYYAGKENFKNKLWAGIAGLLLVSWPSLALYSNVLSPEHLFIFVECALLYAISNFFRQAETGPGVGTDKREILRFAVIGSLVGTLGMFRPFNQLFLIAFLIVFFLYRSRFNPKRTVLSITTLLVFAWLLGSIPEFIADAYAIQFKNVRPCNFLVGMNIEASGTYNFEDVALCEEMYGSVPNKSEFTQKIVGITIDRLALQKDHFFNFIDKKFALLWDDSAGILYWALQLPNGEDAVAPAFVAQKVNLIDFSMMLIATSACLIGTLLAFLKDVKPTIFFSFLCFFGFNLMEVFFEVQTRYRSVIMPMFIFITCWTFATLYMSARENKQERPFSPQNGILQ